MPTIQIKIQQVDAANEVTREFIRTVDDEYELDGALDSVDSAFNLDHTRVFVDGDIWNRTRTDAATGAYMEHFPPTDDERSAAAEADWEARTERSNR